jgi:hypothetical protein
VTIAAGDETVTRIVTWAWLDSNVTAVVAAAVTSEVVVDDETSVVKKVEVGSVFPVTVKVIVKFPFVATLLVGVMVDGGTIELKVDVATIVIVLLKVEAALVVV